VNFRFGSKAEIQTETLLKRPKTAAWQTLIDESRLATDKQIFGGGTDVTSHLVKPPTQWVREPSNDLPYPRHAKSRGHRRRGRRSAIGGNLETICSL